MMFLRLTGFFISNHSQLHFQPFPVTFLIISNYISNHFQEIHCPSIVAVFSTERHIFILPNILLLFQVFLIFFRQFYAVNYCVRDVLVMEINLLQLIKWQIIQQIGSFNSLPHYQQFIVISKKFDYHCNFTHTQKKNSFLFIFEKNFFVSIFFLCFHIGMLRTKEFQLVKFNSLNSYGNIIATLKIDIY